MSTRSAVHSNLMQGFVVSRRFDSYWSSVFFLYFVLHQSCIHVEYNQPACSVYFPGEGPTVGSRVERGAQLGGTGLIAFRGRVRTNTTEVSTG